MPALELPSALLTCLVFYAIYYRRLHLDRSALTVLEAFLAGAVIALALLALSPYASDFSRGLSPMAQGFLMAALPEKALALLAVFYMMVRDRNAMSIKNTIGYGILVGAGFSFVENVAYALIYGSQIVYLRLFSSVAMHLTTSGLMGFLLGMAYLRERKRWLFGGLSFLVPFLLHGFFDFSILSGGAWNYTIPLHVLIPVLVLEALISRAQTLPGRRELAERGIWYEEWALLDRQRGYEKWILRSTDEKRKRPRFFRLPPGAWKNSLAIVILGLPVTVLLNPELIPLSVTLSYSMYLSLFVLLPASVSASILSIGSVNPQFFQGRLLRIPIVLDWEVFEEGIPGPVANGISYELSGRSLYLRGAPTDTEATFIQFRFDKWASPAVPFRVVTTDHELRDGVLIRIERAPGGFRSFQRRYRARRILWGLFYFLHLPGSEGFRKLFIKPRTMAQSRRKYQAGDLVFREGDAARHFYLVEKGRVQIIRDTDTGPVALSTIKEGEIFGEMALVQGEERSATAVCMTETILSSALSDHLESLISSNPDFASALIRTLVTRLIYSEEAFLEKLKSMDVTDLEARTAGQRPPPLSRGKARNWSRGQNQKQEKADRSTGEIQT
jgi:CRP-like cAMP-binding protein/RsiW-degrading membrane proteinase PrsW (M82 family)